MKVAFVQANGTRHEVEAEPGFSLMQAAVNNLVPGIDATCGGDCSCGTCHCYVDENWLERVNPKTEAESAMLEYALNVAPNSRLACQILLDEQCDGLVVSLPASQL